jgi:hypothetical protein
MRETEFLKSFAFNSGISKNQLKALVVPTYCLTGRTGFPQLKKKRQSLVAVGCAESWITTAYPALNNVCATAEPTSPLPRTMMLRISPIIAAARPLSLSLSAAG